MFEKNKNKNNDGDSDREESFKPQKTPPISIENEKKTLVKVQKICQKSLSEYKTTLEVKLKLSIRNFKIGR